jgi:uncharacterized protein (TIGR02266 family)
MLKKNQRKYARVPVRFKVLLSDEECEGFVYFTSRDLSAGGMFLVSDLLLDKESRVRLEFSIPGHKTGVQVEGKIAWAKDEADSRYPHIPSGMGVEFTRISPPNEKIIEDYVVSLLKIKQA